VNLYGFVGNDGVNRVDLLGLSGITTTYIFNLGEPSPFSIRELSSWEKTQGTGFVTTPYSGKVFHELSWRYQGSWSCDGENPDVSVSSFEGRYFQSYSGGPGSSYDMGDESDKSWVVKSFKAAGTVGASLALKDGWKISALPTTEGTVSDCPEGKEGKCLTEQFRAGVVRKKGFSLGPVFLGSYFGHDTTVTANFCCCCDKKSNEWENNAGVTNVIRIRHIPGEH